MTERTENALSIASRVLGVPVDELKPNVVELSDVDGTVVWQSGRGGGTVIVAPDGTFLFASSGVNPGEYETNFANGVRSDSSYLGE